jgi:MFS transporter, ACS family, tartrate transporter
MITSQGQRATQGSEAQVFAKVAAQIFPLVLIGYFLSFLGRVNVSFAALQMNQQLGFTASGYAFGASLFFLIYVLLEMPSNLAMDGRVGRSLL